MYEHENTLQKNSPEARDTDSTSKLKDIKVHGESNALSIRGTSRSRKVPEIPQIEHRNWLIHLHFLQKDFNVCKQLIKEQLKETQGMCEYALYIEGLMMRQDGKLQESLGQFQSCLLLNPKNLENVKQVAKSLFLLGRHKSAAAMYEEIAKVSNKDWDVWQSLGECYQRMQHLDKAKDAFRQALQVNKREETFLSLGGVLTQLKDLSLAADVYKKALDYFTDSPRLHTSIGMLYLKAGAHSKAFEHVGTALTFDPTNLRALLAAGTIMQLNGDHDVALSKYRLAVALAPDSAPLWNNVGMCFFGRKKYVAAIGCLKRASFLAPLEYKILYNLGLVHLTMQQYASAFHFLSAAINLQPTIGQTFMLLAVSLTHLEDDDNARLAYEQAVEMDKVDPVISLNYAIYLYNRGDNTLSAQYLSSYECRLARFCQASQCETDEEHLDIANQLGVALANLETYQQSSSPPQSTKLHQVPAEGD